MSRRKLNARDAAAALGISVDAVRMRARRGTLEAEHDANGRLHIFLDTDETDDEAQSDKDALISEMRDRIASLERRLEQEQQANSEHRRLLARALERIPPQLEAPREAPEASETVEEETERAEAQATTQHEQAQRPTEGVEHDASTPREWTGDVEARRSDAGEAQEGVQRPWWRRMFGG